LFLWDEAILEILFRRPTGPHIRIEEDFIEVKMENLDFMSESIEEEREQSFVERIPDRPSLDWKRLRDSNDDYDEILIDPTREFKPNLDRQI